MFWSQRFFFKNWFVVPFILYLFMGFQSSSQAQGSGSLIPNPKIFKMDQVLEKVSIMDGYAADFLPGHSAFFDWLDKEFTTLNGTQNRIEIELMPSSRVPNSLSQYLQHKSSYYLNHSDGKIEIVAADTAGVLNALTTLKKLLEKNDGQLSDGYIVDWPDHTSRVFHFVARRLTEDDAMMLLEQARYYNFSILSVQVAHGFKLNSLDRVDYREDALERNFLAEFAKKTREFGLDFVPEIKFLSKQHKKLLSDSYPELMYNDWTYDPKLPATKEKVREIIDEIAELTNPKAIHIGHDEVRGVYLPALGKTIGEVTKADTALPAELFKESILFLHDYLSSKNIETWMWGDMFLQRESFPRMHRGPLNSNEEYVGVIDEIPTDIVICDWHYFDKQADFPSVNYFTQKGFKVMGVTWKNDITIKNFSRYIASFEKKSRGMMATTWFHVPGKQWDIVDNVLKTSSENFWNAN